MFKIQPEPTFPASLTLVSHGQEQMLELTLRAKPVEEYDALLATIRKAKAGDATIAAITDAFLALVESWNADQELSKASVTELNRHRPGAPWRVVEAYGEWVVAARKGN